VESGPVLLRRHFREALRDSPGSAYREWFQAQAQLRERGDAETARALADDLWEGLPEIPFDSPEARARFLHNAGVFFGSPGPAADLGRARSCLEQSLTHFAAHSEDGWRARALHNLATAMGNLGTTSGDLQEAVTLFHQALEWRTEEREIARGVTLHNLGLALRRLAELEPPHAREHLRRSATALREALAIRERHGLEEGAAASRAQLGETLSRLEVPPAGGPLPRTGG
jgi:tetratricopeptide (TPR) repeat protein